MPTRTKPVEKKTEAPAPKAKVVDQRLKDKCMQLLVVQHGVAQMASARREGKVTKLEGFVDRAIERGLTLKMVEENIAAGRPPHWIETGE